MKLANIALATATAVTAIAVPAAAVPDEFYARQAGYEQCLNAIEASQGAMPQGETRTITSQGLEFDIPANYRTSPGFVPGSVDVWHPYEYAAEQCGITWEPGIEARFPSYTVHPSSADWYYNGEVHESMSFLTRPEHSMGMDFLWISHESTRNLGYVEFPEYETSNVRTIVPAVTATTTLRAQ